jgi:hypothetical protein
MTWPPVVGAAGFTSPAKVRLREERARCEGSVILDVLGLVICLLRPGIDIVSEKMKESKCDKLKK